MKQTVIDRIVIHCSATPPTMDIGREEIERWHRDRGWRMIGYHGIIRRNGEIEWGRPFDDVPSAHKGFNRNSLALCLIGGVSAAGLAEDNFEPIQHDQWITLCSYWIAQGGTWGFEQEVPLSDVFDAETDLIGHRDLPHVNKACPSFDVRARWTAERRKDCVECDDE